jgi:hypothetical protein
MTNDEIRMPNEARMSKIRRGGTKSETAARLRRPLWSFGLRHSFVILVSSFVILDTIA